MTHYENFSTSFDSENFPIKLNFLTSMIRKGKRILDLGTDKNFTMFLNVRKDCNITYISTDGQVLEYDDETITKLSVEKLENFDLVNKLYGKIFDIILIGNILEQIRKPDVFLNKITPFLMNNGQIIGSVHNIAHGDIRIKLLDGDFTYSQNGILSENIITFFTINSLLSFLHSCKLKLTKLNRIEKELFGYEGKDLKPYIVPQELIWAILRDPDSLTTEYIFASSYDSDTNLDYIWSSSFSKNLTLDDLKNRLADIRSVTLVNENIIKDVEILQKVNIENKKLIDEYVEKINKLVKEIEILQNINIHHQEVLKQKNQEIEKLKTIRELK